ncbi:hypothetical protein Hamer_G019647 [Homarus americanus]|uniref:Uncharacterized protein n=1 Tax=Homarus americanus TaxID=6706 RepID=A0A8J5MV61_HOMAM|nr:hypothetical protein Hamer_G019647 [Homarus americanus]
MIHGLFLPGHGHFSEIFPFLLHFFFLLLFFFILLFLFLLLLLLLSCLQPSSYSNPLPPPLTNPRILRLIQNAFRQFPRPSINLLLLLYDLLPLHGLL